MKKILIFGGTQFIGRRLVELLLENGQYELTLFNRGKSMPNLFPNVKKILGNRRTEDINQLKEGDWDVVIDVSSYHPYPLQKAVDILKDKAKRYIYVSTISVYDDEACQNQVITETTKLKTYTEEDKTAEDITGQNYGPKKVACEEVLLNTPELDSIILRPSVVYGKYDPFDRHYYWLYRIQNQDKILLPEGGKTQLSFTFVDDLVESIIAAIEVENHSGIYNVTTHPVLSLKDIVYAMAKALGKEPEWINTDADWLQNQKVNQWAGISFWTSQDMLMVDNEKITTDFQLQWDDIETSFKKTADYYESLGWPLPKYGISVEREQELMDILVER
ncbi:MAG: NAD-dependent epimerase/dehydratase family protein [Chitinophagales bacterium]